MAFICANSSSFVVPLRCQAAGERNPPRLGARILGGQSCVPILKRQSGWGSQAKQTKFPGKDSLSQKCRMFGCSIASCQDATGERNSSSVNIEEQCIELGESMVNMGRRAALVGLLAAVTLAQALLTGDVHAASIPEPGFKRHIDRLDGYSIDLPQNWIEVRGAGADVFYRNPAVLDESLFVSVSSPSSSNFQGVSDLGSPEDAGQKVLQQYLTEFMSTRIGVRRESQLVNTGSRLGEDGREYYDVELNVKSFSTTNQLAVMPQERPQYMEFDRHYLSTLGVENRRLYELRIQTPERLAAQRSGLLRQILQSLRLEKIEAPAV